MIEVSVTVRKGSISLEAKGHALFDSKGKDMVCCAVSTLLQSWQLGVESLCRAKALFHKESGLMTAEIKEPDERALFLTEYICLSLKVLGDSYKDNIKILLEDLYGRS